MTNNNILFSFIQLIPRGFVISEKRITDIFLMEKEDLATYIQENKELSYKIISSNKTITSINQKEALEEDGIIIHNNKIGKDYFRKPVLSNYYISLVTKDASAIKAFTTVSNKIKLLNPASIFKIPTHYHITLADLNKTPITKKLIKNIFDETDGLKPFIFNCTLHKPYIDTKKIRLFFGFVQVIILFCLLSIIASKNMLHGGVINSFYPTLRLQKFYEQKDTIKKH